MIGWLKGHIIDKSHPGKFVIDVNGVGYDVETSLQTFFQLELQSTALGLHIHTVVREDALLLYGFAEKQERSLFRALIKVNGVGPKLAMSILSSLAPMEFLQCIQQQQTALLTKIPGVGKKTAERLVIELKDTLKSVELSPSIESAGFVAGTNINEQAEAISALEALGYKPQDAMKVVKKLDDGNQSCEQLIRQALKMLS